MRNSNSHAQNLPVWRQIPKGVWALGFVSLLMDVSSEMIHSLLPLFMVTTLGISTVTIGLIEGAAEATALIVKVFSGVISDYLGKRKGLALLGYGLGAFSKPLFAIATGAGVVLSARLIDRVGKGIRGAPRDALVGPWHAASDAVPLAAQPVAAPVADYPLFPPAPATAPSQRGVPARVAMQCSPAIEDQYSPRLPTLPVAPASRVKKANPKRR